MRSSIKLIFILLFFGALLVGSCSQSGKVPKGVLPMDKMSSVMLDIQLAKSYNNSYYSGTANNYPADGQERLKVFHQQILELHHIDTALFLNSFQFYSTHPDMLKKLYKSMDDSLKDKIAYHQKEEEKQRKDQEQKREENVFPITPWEKHMQAWHKFFDSTYRLESPITYPWGNKTLKEIWEERRRLEREQERSWNSVPITPWEKHVQAWHKFFDSTYRLESPITYPWGNKTLKEIWEERRRLEREQERNRNFIPITPWEKHVQIWHKSLEIVHRQESQITYPWGHLTLRELLDEQERWRNSLDLTLWENFSNTWHSFSDSIRKQSSQQVYPWQMHSTKD